MKRFETGDKVKFKSGRHQGSRGIVQNIIQDRVTVRLAASDAVVHTQPSTLINFSLAARKAWRSMPTRQVGRPKGVRSCDRVSVTLRLDRDVWRDFQSKEKSGAIQDRTEIINRWFRQKLAQIGSNATHAKKNQ